MLWRWYNIDLRREYLDWALLIFFQHNFWYLAKKCILRIILEGYVCIKQEKNLKYDNNVAKTLVLLFVWNYRFSQMFLKISCFSNFPVLRLDFISFKSGPILPSPHHPRQLCWLGTGVGAGGWPRWWQQPWVCALCPACVSGRVTLPCQLCCFPAGGQSCISRRQSLLCFTPLYGAAHPSCLMLWEQKAALSLLLLLSLHLLLGEPSCTHLKSLIVCGAKCFYHVGKPCLFKMFMVFLR